MSKKSNPANPAPKPATEIAFILDRSGSMQRHAAAAIGGFNEFLAEQQQVEGLARLSLVLFDDVIETHFDNIPLCEVVPLDTRTYTTRGCTALLDAIGLTIESFEKRIHGLPKSLRPSQVIVAIFTDGLENSSSRFTWKDLAAKIKERQEKDDWQFLFLGANQDAIATAAQMNKGHIKPINSERFINDGHEYVFHLTPNGDTKLDRLAVGVPYSDKSNISRWKHTEGQDLKCRGNVWFIPYKTIQSRAKDRPHPATFPIELAAKCIKLHGKNGTSVVMDPFLGLGHAALAAIGCGVAKFIGFDIDEDYLKVAREEIKRAVGAHEEKSN